ncbi:MAG TPA: tetratricopeptide repeat protein, partial [Thermoanaerobaculia bacterium]|nr:tetratricopeptide repeat protein [Thermoanaerobaculia bacterium]
MAIPDVPVVRLEDGGLDGLVVAAVVAGAAELARKGRYAEAEGFLRERLAAGKTEPAVLDLLARIAAQRGRLREAEEQWQRAASLDPGNESYRAGLRRLARLQRRRVRWPWLALARLGVAVAAVALVLLAGWGVVPRPGAVQAPEPASAAAGQADVAALAERLERIEQLAPAANPAGTAAAPPELRLDLPGVTLRPDGPALVATFDDGLFGGGDRLGTRGRELLTALGRALEPHARTITVSVTGHADD